MTKDPFCTLFVLIHESGDLLYPVRIVNLDTGHIAFRLSRGGKHGNRKNAAIEDSNEASVYSRVLDGWAVRASTKDRKRQGLYKLNARSIKECRRLVST